jgi:hypothetical protein
MELSNVLQIIKEMKKLNAFEKEQVHEFKIQWDKLYRHIDLDLTDREILTFVNRHNISWYRQACDLAANYLLANGAYAQSISDFIINFNK